ncbi:MAG: hypothetical protein HY291_00595 [Planctomycetes bacterium]|nr:hypothetical protein [Planctomycetota bacterium]
MLHRALKIGIPVAALLLAATLGWVTIHGKHAGADSAGTVSGEWLTVERGDFEIVCSEDGELRPVKVTTIGFTNWGKVSWLVPEGTRVHKGDKIVSLETDKLEEEIQQLQDEVATNERNLAQSEQTEELDKKRLEASMLTEKDRLDLARLKEKQILEKPDDLDKQDAANTLKSAEAKLASAKGDYESLAPLVEKGFATRADVESKELSMKLAECDLETARLKAQDLLDGATSEERRKANLDRSVAEAAYKLKEIDRDQQLVADAFAVRAARFGTEKSRERLERRKKNLEESTRTAPHEGIVVYRTVGWEGNKKVSIGDNVGPWMSPVDLPSYDSMKVRTQVPESVVRYLAPRHDPAGAGDAGKPGSAARVRVKTLPGKVYPAEVTWIDGWARDRNAKLSEADIKNKGLSGVRVFDVEVELKESDPDRLRDGFQAIVDFPIETLKSVIAIPAHAVRTVDGRATVQAGVDGKVETRMVRMGKESNGRVVIEEGLREGERVLVPPKPPEEAEPVRAAGEGSAGGADATKAGPGAAGPQGGGAKAGGDGRKGGGGGRKGGGGR